MSSVCVEIAVRDDPRVLLALRSLAAQTRRPDRVLLAASPATPTALLDRARSAVAPLPLTVARFEGGVVNARAGAQRLITEALTAFLDADETAPPEWLARLAAPLESGDADFVGGPTRASTPPVGSIERYMRLLEETIYEDQVRHRVTYLPLQNTAWRTEVLRTVGFDARIPFAEDHDLEIRAARAGYRGRFVESAWVSHASPAERTFGRWARKRYRYLVAMAMSMVKNGELAGRLAERRRPVPHPLRYVEAVMKPVALVDGKVRWARRSRLPIPAPAPVGPVV